MTYKFYWNGRNDNIRNSHKKTYAKIENEANAIITNTIDIGQFDTSVSPSNGSSIELSAGEGDWLQWYDTI